MTIQIAINALNLYWANFINPLNILLCCIGMRKIGKDIFFWDRWIVSWKWPKNFEFFADIWQKIKKALAIWIEKMNLLINNCIFSTKYPLIFLILHQISAKSFKFCYVFSGKNSLIWENDIFTDSIIKVTIK